MVAGIYGHAPMTVGDTIELAFLCDSPEEVDALHAKVVAAGYQSFKEPWSAFWVQRYAIVKDIDGNLLSLFATLPAEN